MNLYEIVMTFWYVMFATGLISLGCHLLSRIEKAERRELKDTLLTSMESTIDE